MDRDGEPWFTPSPRTVQLYLLALAILGFGMAILGFVGELRGWWNDVGEALMTVGSILGLLVTAALGVYGSSESQVESVGEAVERNGDKLDSVDGKLDKLSVIDGKLDRLEKLDAIDDDLDRVQVELDRQTGVLDRQVEVLTQIRDAVGDGAGSTS